MTHSHLSPIDSPVSADRQAARRHYGEYPYFTRRPFNVVQRDIGHYIVRAPRPRPLRGFQYRRSRRSCRTESAFKTISIHSQTSLPRNC